MIKLNTVNNNHDQNGSHLTGMEAFTTTVDRYPSQLLWGLRDLYQRQVCCDLTIFLQGGTSVCLHRAVLAAASTYFQSLLHQGVITEPWLMPGKNSTAIAFVTF